MYGRIENSSTTQWMRATLRIPGCEPKVFRVEPRAHRMAGLLPVVGAVRWSLWTLEWEPPPRKGLMRFSR